MGMKLKLSEAELRKCTTVADLAQAVMDHFRFAKDNGGLLHRYSRGVYKPDGKEFVWKKVQELLELGKNTDKWSSHRCEEVAAYIRTKAQRLWEVPPVEVINVANGLVNVRTRELNPHDPEFLSTIQLPVTHQPDALCPKIHQFLTEVLAPDTVPVAYEIAASLIVPCTELQKAILLYGPGSNGKSMFLDVLEALIGINNVSSVTLQQLQTDRFSAARLVGKLANICADLPDEKLKTTDKFKAIVGGDIISAERKHETSFEIRLSTKLIFSANCLPVAGDRTEGYCRKWLIVPLFKCFPNIPSKKRQLTAELTCAAELSGLLKKALQVLPKVLKEGFSESASILEVMQEFRGGSELEQWLDEETVLDVEAFVEKKALREAFNEDTKSGMTQQAFGRALKRLRPGIREAQRRVEGEPVWVYTGLDFKSPRVSRV